MSDKNFIKRSLAARLGKTTHQSPLRFKIRRFMQQTGYPLDIEDWLVDLANVRGATVVFRDQDNIFIYSFPERIQFSDEELVVGLCQLNCIDQPQMLRLAAQLISRNSVDITRLLQLAVIERTSPILKELAGLALKIEPNHSGWKKIQASLIGEKKLKDPLLHWSRLAEPRFDAPPSLKVLGWSLVA